MTRLDDIAAWYQAHLDTQGDTPVTDAHHVILSRRNTWNRRASQPDATADTLLALAQWDAAMLILAKSARDVAVPGWRDEWTGAYEEYLPEP
ncbi:hypothetical protein OOK31_25460 [Streptomyces sp. NBC_00249]|uniref:hypothetical protein n=1 Tax=Streptomyces sp. NBC_00249 TaxID=2975690 RepID=UPI00225826F7|nr:hypothetical protein [Streptomyces sp. NBC_00249]MCX5197205.1 hypothetical protein [Streptomyces sp. NBC_00249]